MDMAILVLAGGGSKRFGEDKALFRLNGKPLIQHVVERISGLSEELLISCKRKKEVFEKMFPRAKVIEDEWDEESALAGLLSSLPHIRSEYVAVIACDSPRVSPRVIESLFAWARTHDGAVPIWPNGYLEPLQAVYRTSSLFTVAEDKWVRRERRLKNLLDSMEDIIYVPITELKRVDPKLDSFLNINSPNDLKLI